MNFRPVAFWQSALQTLPDDAFFELTRSVLGSVKTPFNKQTLVDELARFIARPEIQETIAAYIDEGDRRLIAAIALLEEPLPGELESFFSGEYSFVELQGMLLNLEERLIIYRFRDDDEPEERTRAAAARAAARPLRIALNPRLETILGPIAAAVDILFPSIPGAEDPGAHDREAPGIPFHLTLAALYGFLTRGPVLAREGEWAFRKKTLDEGRRLFPGMDLSAAAGAFLCLGLAAEDGESLEPDDGRLAVFKGLPARERLEYFAAALALHQAGKSGGAGQGLHFNRGLLRSAARLIHALINQAASTEGGRGIFPEATLVKLAELLRRKEEGGWGLFGTVDPRAVLPSGPELLKVLAGSGLLAALRIRGEPCYRLASWDEAESPDRPLIAVDAGFSCILYPEIPFADALDLAVFSTVEETGAAPRFVLSRSSVVRGFDRGYSAESLWQLLDRLSGGRAPDSLKWNLDDWEKRWKEVLLLQGTVLVLSGERSYLAEKGPLSPLVKQTLAPGVYLLSGNVEEAAEMLRGAGVDIVARGTPARSGADRRGSPPSFYRLEEMTDPDSARPGPAERTKAAEAKAAAKTAEAAERPEAKAAEAAGSGAKAPGSAGTRAAKTAGAKAAAKNAGTKNAAEAKTAAAAIKDRFRSLLAGMKLSPQEREELEARIERRLVVSEEQLKGASLRYEKLEARAMDYVGKTGLVRQALASGSLLEVSALGKEERKILGTPESLDKKGGEMILSIRPREGGEPVKIPLGKISLVRRIKQSIFGV